MLNILFLLSLSLTLTVPTVDVFAKDDKELRKQRNAAQKERQTTKNERNKEINEANRAFREFTRDLKREYQDLVKDLDMEFDLAKVDLQGEKQAKIATAEAEFQKKWSALFLRPEGDSTQENIQGLEKEAKAHSDKLFQIKKEAAEIFHKAKMANLQKKHDLLRERDKKAMDEAASLGLTKDYPPILAKPIGGALTKQEDRWNEREKKEVIKIKERNNYGLREFRNGGKLRAWERKNQDEDFTLKWKEKEDLHNIRAEQTYFNTMIMQGGEGLKANLKEFNMKIAELGKQQRLTQIEYNKIKQKNNLTRRQERKKILEQ